MAKRSSLGPLVLVAAASSCTFYVACGDDDVIFGEQPNAGSGGDAGSSGMAGEAGSSGTGGSTGGTGGMGGDEPDGGPDASDSGPDTGASTTDG
jgi:hypothetical protein